MAYRYSVDGVAYQFDDLRAVMAKATPVRSGDQLVGLAADSAVERIAAQAALSELPLKTFLNETVIPYESDNVTRLILDNHDAEAFAPVSHLTVGEFRNWLLGYEVDALVLTALAHARDGGHAIESYEPARPVFGRQKKDNGKTENTQDNHSPRMPPPAPTRWIRELKGSLNPGIGRTSMADMISLWITT